MPDWSKKLSFALLALICATVLVWHGDLTADQWVAFAKWDAIFYLGGQAAVDVVARLKK